MVTNKINKEYETPAIIDKYLSRTSDVGHWLYNLIDIK